MSRGVRFGAPTRRDFLKLLGATAVYPLVPRFPFAAPAGDQRYEDAWAKLQEDLTAEIERYTTRYARHAEVSISLVDLQTDQRLSIGGDVPRQPGCVINQFVLYSLVEDFQRGLLEYDPLARAIYLAIGESKAQVARNLLQLTGGGSVEEGVARINARINELGLKDTSLDHPPAFWGEYSVRGQPNAMTTDDAVEVMRHLYRNDMFDEEWSSFTIQRLTEGKRGLNIYIGLAVRDLPFARVAHKVGYFPDGYELRDMDGDAGLVLIDTPAGEIAYAMAILSEGNEPSPDNDHPSFVYNGWFTWAVSKLAFDFFSEQYATGDPREARANRPSP